MCYCHNYFTNNLLLEALNKGAIKINNFSIGKDNKDQAYLIPINSKKALNFYEETIINILEKNDLKKRHTLKTEKDNNFERQNGDDNMKKYKKYKKI